MPTAAIIVSGPCYAHHLHSQSKVKMKSPSCFLPCALAWLSSINHSSPSCPGLRPGLDNDIRSQIQFAGLPSQGFTEDVKEAQQNPARTDPTCPRERNRRAHKRLLIITSFLRRYLQPFLLLGVLCSLVTHFTQKK